MQPIRVEQHRGDDDLLTAGLGAAGLRSMTPPAFADASRPTPAELRRRAIWSNWRGIADLSEGGGFGQLYGSLASVPGREYHDLMRLAGAQQPHRVMLQLPDRFDPERRCLLVTASSGSRGIYGAIALAGSWGLPRGCAVAYTDKGAGTGYVDLDAREGVDIEGTRSGDVDAVEFMPSSTTGAVPHRIAIKHLHSGDNPEAHWGRHVRQAAEFGLRALNLARPDEAPFTFENTRVIATGLSNGGGAVLRAAEDESDWLDAVVAIAPNILAGEGGRALFDYATEAALFMPCALLHPRFDTHPFARPGGAASPAALQRCASLVDAGLLAPGAAPAQAQEALERLHRSGWSDAAIEAGALSVAFDLWRAVAAGYASAYSRSPSDAMPCGYGYAALDANGDARESTTQERVAWWSDASGIPPGAGIGLLDSMAAGLDPALPGLRCLRALWEGSGESSLRLRQGIEATRARMPREGLPMVVIHGADDGLVPQAFSAEGYARWVTSQGGALTFWSVPNAQHFDAFVGLPALETRYVPLLPYAYRALDAVWAHLEADAAMPSDRVFETRPRAQHGSVTEALDESHLGLR